VRRSTKPYSLAAALMDSRYYDDACSIKTGLKSLLDIAPFRGGAAPESMETYRVGHDARRGTILEKGAYG
jgi:hypothetical protein